ncbi:MAG: pyridoxamine 5'-phosphate oxidase family protein [Thermoplasmata archaeon]
MEFDEGQSELLKKAGLLRVATITSHGDPFMVPVRFYFDGKAVYFTSPDHSPQIINLRGNRRICVLVDEVDDDSSEGVVAQGLAQFVRGGTEAGRVLEAMARKYSESSLEEAKGTLVKVIPVRIFELGRAE